MLYIVTSKQVLDTLFAGGSLIFCIFAGFPIFCLILRQKKIRKKKKKKRKKKKKKENKKIRKKRKFGAKKKKKPDKEGC